MRNFLTLCTLGLSMALFGFGCGLDDPNDKISSLPDPLVDTTVQTGDSGAGDTSTTQPADSTSTQASDAPATTQPAEAVAVFGGGCFWCVEAVFEELKGVKAVISGYAGGAANTANYEMVSAGRTKHAEVVQIVYDPNMITFGQLLKVFFATHDPTQLNAQGPDRGTQYRTSVFYADEKQKETTAAYIKQLNEAGVFSKPIVTTLEPLEQFHAAEGYHQDFWQNNPTQRYAAYYIPPKLEKLNKKFPELVKDKEGE